MDPNSSDSSAFPSHSETDANWNLLEQMSESITNDISEWMSRFGKLMKACLIFELQDGTEYNRRKYETLLGAILRSLIYLPDDDKTKDQFAAKIIKQVFTIYLLFRENYFSLPDNLVIVLTKLFEAGSPKTLKKVANRKVWKFLELHIKFGCDNVLLDILVPTLCLIDKLPERSEKHLNALVVFKLQTQRLKSILDTGVDLETVDKTMDNLLTKCKRLNQLFKYYYPDWLGLSKICRSLRETSDDSALKDLAQFIKQMEGRHAKVIDDNISRLAVEVLSELKLDEARTRLFLRELLEIQIVDGRVAKYNSSPFERFVSLMDSAISHLYIEVGSMSDQGCAACTSGDCKENISSKLFTILELLDYVSFVNESWYMLFGLPETSRIVDRELFVNHIQSGALSKNLAEATDIEEIDWYSSLIRTCPLSFQSSLRQEAFHKKLMMERDKSTGSFNFGVSRENVMENWKSLVITNRNILRDAWYIHFKGEEARGYGPTKEFYSLLALEFQKHYLGLWEGEPVIENIQSGKIVYTYSPDGLFPRLTKVEDEVNEPYDDDLFTLFAMTMAKTLLDGYWLDMPLSVEFFRQYVCQRRDPLCWSIYEVPKVIPKTHKLIQQLVVVKNKKSLILQNEDLSKSEKQDQIDNLMFDEGCSFEDLCINFTIPGRPDLAITEDGQNIYLNSTNVEQYLDILAFTVLHGSNLNKIMSFREGFEEVLDLDHLGTLLPEEMQKMVCGETFEKWTVEYLVFSSQLEQGLSIESDSVRYLFEVLSSLDGDEQRLFLKFVTGTGGLPFGGLKNLDPPLTIVPVSHDPQEEDKKLPSATTCTNTIFIPSYSSLEVTREKLLFAITEGRDYFGFV